MRGENSEESSWKSNVILSRVLSLTERPQLPHSSRLIVQSIVIVLFSCPVLYFSKGWALGPGLQGQ